MFVSTKKNSTKCRVDENFSTIICRSNASRQKFVNQQHIYLEALQQLRHCKNQVLDGDNSDQQNGTCYKDRLDEYLTLSKQESLTLAERYTYDIHYTIDT